MEFVLTLISTNSRLVDPLKLNEFVMFNPEKYQSLPTF